MIDRTLTSLSGAALLLAALAGVPAEAQDVPPPQETAAPAQLEDPAAEEPAVQTSPAAEPGEATGPGEAAEHSAAQPAATSPAGARNPRFKTVDRLELESTAITGNRELPKVLYIVPWKKSDLGDLLGRPASSLLDEVLAPVDRDVFRRQTEYFSTLDQGAAGTGQAPEPQPEQDK